MLVIQRFYAKKIILFQLFVIKYSRNFKGKCLNYIEIRSHVDSAGSEGNTVISLIMTDITVLPHSKIVVGAFEKLINKE